MSAQEAHLLSQDAYANVTASNLLERLDLERLDISVRLAAEPKRRADLGQYFTPSNVARFMAGMLKIPNPPSELRLLDAGGGSGILTAAVVAELCNRPNEERPSALHATVWEIDTRLTQDLRRTFEHCRAIGGAAGMMFTGEIRQENFILSAAESLGGGSLFSPQQPLRFHVARPTRARRSGDPPCTSSSRWA